MPILNENIRKMQNGIDRAPRTYTGTAAPTIIPYKTGDIFIDTTNAKIYVSTGITATTDWKILN
jgi:hypothetical protein